jgi:hypothetical protein
MKQRIDLTHVGVTTHAFERWVERIGLDGWLLWGSLARSVPANRGLRRRVREAQYRRSWPGRTLVRVDRATGAVFVIAHGLDRSTGCARPWKLVTVLPLWACRAGGDVVEVEREAESCA